MFEREPRNDLPNLPDAPWGARLADRTSELGARGSWLLVGKDTPPTELTAERKGFHLRAVPDLDPEPGESYDGVILDGLLHRQLDPAELLRRATARVAPRGALLIFDLQRPVSEEQLDEWCEQHAETVFGEDEADFRLRLRAALTPEELRMEALVLGLLDAEVRVDSEVTMSLHWAAASRASDAQAG